MAFWLVKSEPSAYSWQQLVKDKKTAWTGVRNYAARNNLMAMSKGDEVFFYHSNEDLQIVGIARVAKTHYPDPTAEGDRWQAVDLEVVRPLRRPVSLEEIKQNKSLTGIELVRIGRLSVSKVTPTEWRIILGIAGENL